MELIIVSFFAGILTILAPCVLPLLPVILGSSAGEAEQKSRPYIIIASLVISVMIFTILLKTTIFQTAQYFIGTPETYLKIFSGVIIFFFGIITLFPNLWKKISGAFSSKANSNLVKSANETGIKGSILVGMSLGPVFSSCSPTYGVILSVVIPASTFVGLVNLFAYVLGLAIIMLVITLLGNKFISKMKWASDPNGLFKKILGVLFLFIGIAIIFGFDKDIEAYIIEQGYYGAGSLEEKFLDNLDI